MTSVAVVRAECPTCGAPLDLDDGVGAMRCGHCRSQLLVTGRRQVLSYRIAARMAEPEARSLVRFSLTAGGQATQVGTGRLYLIPYYRVTAEELSWDRSARVDEEQRRRNVLEVAAWLEAGGSPARAVPWSDLDDVGHTVPWSDLDDVGHFDSRVVERNFLARHTSIVPASLGVRPGVLRLLLFDPGAIPPDAVVVAPGPEPPPDEPGHHDRGLRRCSRVRLRETVQIVYFPYWIFPLEGRGARCFRVVDAVAGRLLPGAAECGSVEALATGSGPRPRTLGFRPLACPNCGWDLPLRPTDVVFQCGSCQQGWLMRGDRMEPVPFSVVDGGGADRHLPIWKLGGSEGDTPVFAPAFRCRRLKALVDLGIRLTRRGVAARRSDRIPGDLVGCALDERDARTLARFIVAGIDDEAARGTSSPTLPEPMDSRAELLWLPFESDGYAWREAATGSPVPRRLLDV